MAAFNLDKVNKAGARFDFDKAKWFNQQHLRLQPEADLVADYRFGSRSSRSVPPFGCLCFGRDAALHGPRRIHRRYLGWRQPTFSQTPPPTTR